MSDLYSISHILKDFSAPCMQEWSGFRNFVRFASCVLFININYEVMFYLKRKKQWGYFFLMAASFLFSAANVIKMGCNLTFWSLFLFPTSFLLQHIDCGVCWIVSINTLLSCTQITTTAILFPKNLLFLCWRFIIILLLYSIEPAAFQKRIIKENLDISLSPHKVAHSYH